MIKNNEKNNGKIYANLKLDKKRPKIQSKSIWGGSWVLFGRGLGPSWASFGCFWPPLGRFLNVQSRASFKHWPKMGSKRASGWILGRFGRIWGRFLGGFGEKFRRILELPWHFSNATGVSTKMGPPRCLTPPRGASQFCKTII